jgi:hypothetical protein
VSARSALAYRGTQTDHRAYSLAMKRSNSRRSGRSRRSSAMQHLCPHFVGPKFVPDHLPGLSQNMLSATRGSLHYRQVRMTVRVHRHHLSVPVVSHASSSFGVNSYSGR